MSQSLIDQLATSYLMERAAKIDHGLDQPRPGGFGIVRNLQKDLLKEQDEELGGERYDNAEWAKKLKKDAAVSDIEETDDPELANEILARLFATPDLFVEMMEADGEVTASRSDIVKTTIGTVTANGQVWDENFYSTKITYTIDLSTHLQGRGVPDFRQPYSELAKVLDGGIVPFEEYIERNGDRELLDKWLPGKTTDPEYALTWSVESVRYREPDMVDVNMKVSERWLSSAE